MAQCRREEKQAPPTHTTDTKASGKLIQVTASPERSENVGSVQSAARLDNCCSQGAEPGTDAAEEKEGESEVEAKRPCITEAATSEDVTAASGVADAPAALHTGAIGDRCGDIYPVICGL